MMYPSYLSGMLPDSSLLMNNSMGANPAVNPNQDAASRFMNEQASQLEAPQAPPAMAGPIPQFFSLLAANSGANLLRQPGASEGAERAVQAEMRKPELYRQEGLSRQEEARSLRMKAMIRTADQAAAQAEKEGDFKRAVALREKTHEWTMQEDAANNAIRVRAAEIAAGSREKVAGIAAAARVRKTNTAAANAKWPPEVNRTYQSKLSVIQGARSRGEITDDEAASRIEAAYAESNALAQATNQSGHTFSAPTLENAALIRPQVPPAAVPPVGGAAPGGSKLSDDPKYSEKTRAALRAAGK